MPASPPQADGKAVRFAQKGKDMDTEVYYQLDEGDNGQPGRLEWAVFITFSHVARSNTHHVWARVVRRRGWDPEPRKAHWTGVSMPDKIYRELIDTVRAMVDSEIDRRYGVQTEFPE